MAAPGHADNAMVLESKQPRKHDERELSLQLSHIYPKILALGILLLEIELGHDILGRTPIDAAASDYRLHPNMQHQMAAGIIVSPEWKTRGNVKTAVRQAIEICIKPDTGVLGYDPNLIRQRLFSKVVQPLRSLFMNMYECEDGCPENFNPGPIKLYSLLNKLDDAGGAAELSTQLASVDSNESAGKNTKERWSVESQTNKVHIQDWALFGDEDEDLHHLGTAVATDAWVARFKGHLNAYGIGRDKSEPIKVAIIDTGIDTNHEDIKEQEEAGRIKQCKSFVPGEDATVDQSGHGTHIAGIILDLTRNVELYIAKIFKKRVYGEEESTDIRKRMVQALIHCREIWKVNMISLSFGYGKPSAPDTIWNEIDVCIMSKIIVFAAASNDAGNRPRTYPGAYQGVLCIHSATGGGNASIFNPSPEKHDDNFTFVGEALDSYWTAGLPIDGGSPHDRKRRRSGTSFATPVAVATAAFMVGFIRREIRDHYWGYAPLSPLGIRIIFRELSQKRQSYSWVDPEWYFSKYNKGKVKADLIHVLNAHPRVS